MKITVPFVYQAEVIKKRCRNPITINVRDSVEVDIQEVSTLPIAFRIEDEELFWDGVNLFGYDWTSVYKEEPRKVRAELVKENTENEAVNYKYSCSGADAPFHNFWHETFKNDAWLKDEDAKTRPEHEVEIYIRKWVSDDKAEIIQKAKEIAAKRLIMDGLMIKKSREPMYYALTFGLGNNHGGTGMGVGCHLNPNLDVDCYFPANQPEEAVAYAERIALGRGDTNYVPMQCPEIEVLIPEAVRYVRATEEGEEISDG